MSFLTTSQRLRRAVQGCFDVLDRLRISGDLPAVRADNGFLSDPAGTDDQSGAWIPVPTVEIGLQEDTQPVARDASKIDRC